MAWHECRLWCIIMVHTNCVCNGHGVGKHKSATLPQEWRKNVSRRRVCVCVCVACLHVCACVCMPMCMYSNCVCNGVGRQVWTALNLHLFHENEEKMSLFVYRSVCIYVHARVCASVHMYVTMYWATPTSICIHVPTCTTCNNKLLLVLAHRNILFLIVQCTFLCVHIPGNRERIEWGKGEEGSDRW